MKINPFGLFVFFLCLAGATFPFSARIYFLIVIVVSVVWLMGWRKNLTLLRSFEVLMPMILTLPYLVLLIGMLYTESTKNGWKELETSSSLVIMPILILRSSLSGKNITTILTVFSISVFLICTLCFAMAIQKAVVLDHDVYTFFTSYLYQTSNFSEPVGIHPTYLSMFIAMSIATLIFESNKILNSYLKVGMISTLFMANLFLLSRGGLLAMVFCVVLIGMNILVQKKKYVAISGSLLLIVLFSYFLLTHVPGFSNRFRTPFFKFSEFWKSKNPQNSTELHFKSWQCAIEKLSTGNHLLYGYGTGDEIDVLTSCYQQKGLTEMVDKGYNSHSQYLSTLMKTGLIGLIIFIVCMIASLKIALTNNDYVFISFLLIFFTISLFESTLNVYRGVVFFSFFNALLIKRNLRREHLIN